MSQAPGILRFLDCVRLAGRSSVFVPGLMTLLVEASLLGPFVMMLIQRCTMGEVWGKVAVKAA
jgi:hypothetical protein